MEFDSFGDYELAAIYNGLCQLVASAAVRRYLRNNDPAHPAYSPRRSSTAQSDTIWGDGPAANHLFRIGEAIHRECIRRNIKFFDVELGADFDATFAGWEKFCECVRNGQVGWQLP